MFITVAVLYLIQGMIYNIHVHIVCILESNSICTNIIEEYAASGNRYKMIHKHKSKYYACFSELNLYTKNSTFD